MHAHYLQHVPFENLGSIRPWLESTGYEISATQFYKSATLPAPETIDLLIILGGPMNVNDEDRFPWLRSEKKFIRDSIKAGKAVLGVCLGAQLIASALGESVYPNRRKEIGWFPVEGVPSNNQSTFCFPPAVEVFHWHDETFDLPQQAILLARSEACENQAFQLGNSVIGLQFHLESTPETVRAITTNCKEELLPSKFVQPEAAILDRAPDKYKQNNDLLGDILTYLTAAITDNVV